MRRRDDGFTLIEVMVAMTIMAVVMTMVTGAVIQIYHAVNSTDAVTQAQDQVNAAFVRLDKEVRYARGISAPAQLDDGDWYVEYLISADAVDTCVEVRLDPAAKVLQRRQWTKNSSPLNLSAWQTLADNVTATTPFTVVQAAANASPSSFRFQRLTLAMTSVTGGGTPNSAAIAQAGAKRETNVTFGALNATSTTAGAYAQTCTEARGVSS